MLGALHFGARCSQHGNIVFGIKGTDYRLAARIDFANGIVRHVAVDAHAEYHRWRL
jgi:mRNA-degrading endonuclease HigB of HigAB toxin-antitoxin module